jgi:hypothetical protein
MTARHRAAFDRLTVAMQFADDQESADEEERPHTELAHVDGEDVALVGQENENDGDGSQAVESFDVSDFAHEGIRGTERGQYRCANIERNSRSAAFEHCVRRIRAGVFRCSNVGEVGRAQQNLRETRENAQKYSTKRRRACRIRR